MLHNWQGSGGRNWRDRRTLNKTCEVGTLGLGVETREMMGLDLGIGVGKSQVETV